MSDKERNDNGAMIGRHGHPGYTLGVPEEARQHPLETYTKGHELYEKHELLREDFARGMREAKICVFDASLERKLIRKVCYTHMLWCQAHASTPRPSLADASSLETFRQSTRKISSAS